MSSQHPSKDKAALFKILGEHLSTCPEVTRYDEGEHKEAWALAHTFLDLEESFRTFLEDQLPKLTQGDLKAPEVYDLLLDIGEEFRHILYHIKAPRFYSHLYDEKDE